MAQFTDIELEKLADAERLLRQKANTLGADGQEISEPFRRVNNAVLGEVWQSQPSTEGGLIFPDYLDDPESGNIGTRHVELRLHSYLPSGKEGAESVQTFIYILIAQ